MDDRTPEGKAAAVHRPSAGPDPQEIAAIVRDDRPHGLMGLGLVWPSIRVDSGAAVSIR